MEESQPTDDDRGHGHPLCVGGDRCVHARKRCQVHWYHLLISVKEGVRNVFENICASQVSHNLKLQVGVGRKVRGNTIEKTDGSTTRTDGRLHDRAV